MPRRTRRQQIEDEKAEAGATGGWMTSGDLCKYLNIDPRTFRYRRQFGKIPPPQITSPNGWALWSPEQCAELLKQELERKKRR